MGSGGRVGKQHPGQVEHIVWQTILDQQNPGFSLRDPDSPKWCHVTKHA